MSRGLTKISLLWDSFYHAQFQLILVTTNIYFMLIKSLMWVYDPELSNSFLMFWPVLEIVVSSMYKCHQNIAVVYKVYYITKSNSFVTITWQPCFLVLFFPFLIFYLYEQVVSIKFFTQIQSPSLKDPHKFIFSYFSTFLLWSWHFPLQM